MKTKLPEKINTEREAKAFLFSLVQNGEIFHPEDDARSLNNNPFTDDEAIKLNALMNEIYQLDSFDPCAYILDLQYDTIIKHGELYCMGHNYGQGGPFRWSSNLSEAWRLSKNEQIAFLKSKKFNKWPYELERVPK